MALSKIETSSLDVGQIGGRRNVLINGAMIVAQRATTASSTDNSFKTVDRFKAENGTTGAHTESQVADAPSGFNKSFKLECTSTSNSAGYGLISQRIEGQDVQHFAYGTSDAKYVTLSFWVKSNMTGPRTVEFWQANGNRYNTHNFTISQADTWEYITLTASPDTAYAIPNITSEGFRIFIWTHGGDYDGGTQTLDTWEPKAVGANRVSSAMTSLYATVGNYIQITGVQLEVGSVATPFEHRSYGEELALCQRYFQIYYPNRENAVYTSYSNQFHMGQLTLQPTMRTTPSASWYDGNMRFAQVGYNGVSATMTNTQTHAFTTSGMNGRAFHFVITRDAGGSVPTGDSVYNSEGSTARFFIDAEL